MILKLGEKTPALHPDSFLADDADLIGDVTVGAKTSIWYHAVLRGDLSPIRIGEYSNIQDNCTLHGEPHQSVIIGNHVTVGHQSIIHACEIEDNVLIGMGAIILNGAKIKKNCIIGAGAVVTGNKVIEEGSLVMGIPGKIIRKLTEEEIHSIHESSLRYAKLSDNHKGVK